MCYSTQIQIFSPTKHLAHGPFIFPSVIQFPFSFWASVSDFFLGICLAVADSGFQTILNSWREINAIDRMGSADWSCNQGNCTYTAAKWSLCSFNSRPLLISLPADPTEDPHPHIIFSLHAKSNCGPAVIAVDCLFLYIDTVTPWNFWISGCD